MEDLVFRELFLPSLVWIFQKKPRTALTLYDIILMKSIGRVPKNKI